MNMPLHVPHLEPQRTRMGYGAQAFALRSAGQTSEGSLSHLGDARVVDLVDEDGADLDGLREEHVKHLVREE